MSRPGYWKLSTGEEIPYAEMRTPHLRNSMRMMARKHIENAPEDGEQTILALSRARKAAYYLNKLVDLADEAERRGGILPPGDMTEDALVTLVSGWPTARDTEAPANIATDNRTQPYAAIQNISLRRIGPRATEAIAKQPPKRIGIYLNVIREVELLIGLPVHGLEDANEQPYRRIEMDL